MRWHVDITIAIGKTRMSEPAKDASGIINITNDIFASHVACSGN